MRADQPPRPIREQKTTVGAVVSVVELGRLHRLAAARQTTVSQLVVQALDRCYPRDADERDDR